MKKLLTTKLVALAFAGSLQAQNDAQIQVIHNSPDPAAAAVDIFVNGFEVLSNVNYRQASSFLSVDASNTINVGIAAASDNNTVNDTLFNFPFNLTPGENYYVIADGLVGTNFDLYASNAARTQAASAGNTDFMIYHGSIDAPTVDIYAEEAGVNLANDLSWSEFNTSVSEVGNADYNIQVRNDASTATVAAYEAPLATLGLEDSALLVMASGYLQPALGQPSFGLFAVLANGSVQTLPTAAARAQIVHNSAVAGLVDVWVNNAKALSGVDYRNASAFIDFPAGLNQAVAVTAAGATDTSGAPINVTLTTEARETYYVVANGGDNGKDLGLFVKAGAREEALESSKTDVMVFHGSTDAPTVDVWEVSAVNGEIVGDLAYSKFDGYLELATADYNLQIRDEAGASALYEYSAPLSTLNLDGASILVIASGEVSANSSDAFGLFVALPAGGALVPLTESTVSVSENPIAGLSIYPNPSNSVINVEYADNTDLQFNIYSVEGRLVKTGNLSGYGQIDIQALNAGSYVIQLSNENGLSTVNLIKK